jgi:RNA polymerase sigma-70 factor (sigma-E family)
MQTDSEVRPRMSTGATRDRDFSSYMEARQPSLLRTAYLLAGDRHTAEDLVQVAFAKLYLSWDKVRDQEALDGYVRRILVNEHNSLWRRAWKRREQSSDEVPEHGRHDAYDEGSDLWAVIQTLPRRTRAVIVLRYYEELSEAEIAEALGITRGTVKSQASRGLALLRERTTTTPREEER